MVTNLDDLRIPYGLAVHDHEEEDAVLEVIKNHKTIMGEKVKKFENQISELFGKQFGTMVNSGSSANLLTFEILDIPENAEVITPILTFATTISPIIKKGLTPVFVDVEPQTNVVNIDQIEQSINKDSVWDRPSWPLKGSPTRVMEQINEFMNNDYNLSENDRNQQEYYKNKLIEESLTYEQNLALKSLGLKMPINLDQIKKKYKKLVKIFHPDVNDNNKEAETKFKEINESNKLLLKKFVKK